MRGVLILLAVLGIGAGLWRSQAQPGESGYAAIRKGVLLDQAQSAPKGGVLLIGDSLTERAPVDRLCGLPVFTAGVSGAGVEDFNGMAAQLAQTLKPKLTIIAVGVNDAQWTRDNPNLAESFRTIDADVGGASYVLPLMPDSKGQFGTAYFDPTKIVEVRQAIVSLHRPTLAPFNVMGHTIDGVHLDAAAKAVWRERLSELCH